MKNIAQIQSLIGNGQVTFWSIPMTRIIKTLFDRKRPEPTPEEIEAFRMANEALQFRVNLIARQGLSHQPMQRSAA